MAVPAPMYDPNKLTAAPLMNQPPAPPMTPAPPQDSFGTGEDRSLAIRNFLQGHGAAANTDAEMGQQLGQGAVDSYNAYKSNLTPAPPQNTVSAPPTNVSAINQPPAPVQTPAPTSNWSTTPAQAAQSAKEQATARINQLLAGGKNAYDTGVAGVQNSRDYNQKITQGNRSLRDATNYAKSDPFQGSTMENKFRLQREDGINDTFTNNNYDNQLASLSKTWQDLQTSAPEQQQALYDKLYSDAAQMGIQADQLNATLQNNQFNQGIAQAGVTGQYNGQDTIQKTASDIANQGNILSNQGQQTTNSLNALKLADYPAQSQAAAQQTQQDLATGKINQETAQFKLDQLKDPNSPTNQANAIDLQLKQMDLANAPQEEKLKLEQLQKTIAQIGAAPYQSENDKAMDTVKLQIAQEQLKELQNPKNSSDLSKELDGLYTGLSSGQITGGAAIDEITSKLKAGIVNPGDAAQMLTLIHSVTSSQPTTAAPTLTQTQIDANGGNNPQDLNSTQLEKLWNTDPTGKAAGKPQIDWAQWYRDPRGRVGGVSYDAWHQTYGPQLKAK